MSENRNNTGPARDESPTKAHDPVNATSLAGGEVPPFCPSSVPATSSMTLDPPHVSRPTNGDTAGQNGRQQPSPVSQAGDSKEPLEDFDWNGLEERFCKKMEECGKVEKELEGEFNEWLQVCQESRLKLEVRLIGFMKVFKAWSSVTSIHEPERAHKRYIWLLCTLGDKHD